MARSSSSAGFTLVEIIVGLLVSSLILLSLNFAMTQINRGSLRTQASIGEQTSFAAALKAIAGDLSRIERVPDDAFEPVRFEFAGRASELRYVLAERPSNNRAGLYWVRLLVREGAGGIELARQRQPYVRGKNDAEWRDEVILLSGRFGAQFAYRAASAGFRGWSPQWQPANLLPGQIKLEITDLDTRRLRVPVFVQTLKIDAETACAGKDAPGCTLKTNGILQ
ncbi:MAG: prepilin-type N-terminal cleavage/methylation domain-containing protein [Rhizobiales bacterium]|nr:prepilin-type N-terminal cleavage/methylation domain-containing protein [Hyphomicrobiales bacterium]